MIRIPRLSVSEFFTNSIGKEMNEMKRTKNWICMAMCLLLVLLALSGAGMICLIVLSLNLLGDGLRDAADPYK